MKIKHLIFPIVALLAFVVGVFAVDLSPPTTPITNVAQTNKSECNSVTKIKLDEFMTFQVCSKEPNNLNRKAEATTTNNFYPNFGDSINHQAKIAKRIYDLPPNEYRQKLGYNGNKANQIRADPNF